MNSRSVIFADLFQNPNNAMPKITHFPTPHSVDMLMQALLDGPHLNRTEVVFIDLLSEPSTVYGLAAAAVAGQRLSG